MLRNSEQHTSDVQKNVTYWTCLRNLVGVFRLSLNHSDLYISFLLRCFSFFNAANNAYASQHISLVSLHIPQYKRVLCFIYIFAEIFTMSEGKLLSTIGYK